MSNTTYPLLAIDGGGTKTIAVITDKKGSVLGVGKAGATNYQVVGRKAAQQSLQDAIQQAIEEVKSRFGHSDPVAVEKAVIALAGLDTQNDQRIVDHIVCDALQSLQLNVRNFIVENDCLSALLGATQQSPGVLLISGTGSIVFAHDGKGRYVRAGGWGHRVGDEGSGYWIGKEAIRAVLKMYDGREEPSVLSNLILNHFQFHHIEDLYNWVYSEHYSVDDVSALTRIVEEAASQNDAVSQAILERAVSELEQLLYAVLARVSLNDEHVKLVLQGGVLQHNRHIRDQILNKLKRTHPNLQLLSNQKEPIYNIIRRGLTFQTDK